MAIDTRDDRGSLIGLDLPTRVWPNPTGMLTSDSDRLHLAYKYRLLSDTEDDLDGEFMLLKVGP